MQAIREGSTENGVSEKVSECYIIGYVRDWELLSCRVDRVERNYCNVDEIDRIDSRIDMSLLR